MSKNGLLNERKECKKQLDKRINESMMFSTETYTDEALRYAAEENYKEIRRLANRIVELDKRISRLPKTSLIHRLKETLGL